MICLADNVGLVALAGADPSDSADPVDPSHKGKFELKAMFAFYHCSLTLMLGPVMAYLLVLLVIGFEPIVY